MPSNNYNNYPVKYWNHNPVVNCCTGNVNKKTIRARTDKEAIRLAEKHCGSAYFFKLHSAELVS